MGRVIAHMCSVCRISLHVQLAGNALGDDLVVGPVCGVCRDKFGQIGLGECHRVFIFGPVVVPVVVPVVGPVVVTGMIIMTAGRQANG